MGLWILISLEIQCTCISVKFRSFIKIVYIWFLVVKCYLYLQCNNKCLFSKFAFALYIWNFLLTFLLLFKFGKCTQDLSLIKFGFVKVWYLYTYTKINIFFHLNKIFITYCWIDFEDSFFTMRALSYISVLCLNKHAFFWSYFCTTLRLLLYIRQNKY